MRAAGPLRLGLLLGGGFVAPLQGQRADVSVDVGTATMRYADSIHARSASISPQLRVSGDRAALTAVGSLSQLDGSWSNSGRLDASVVPFSRGRVSAELAVVTGGSSHANGARTGQMLAAARLHAATLTRGLWAGAGGGRTWDGAWRDVLQADAGAWLAGAVSTAMISVAPTVVDDTIRYVDSFLSLHRDQAAWELDGSLGVRAGQQLPTLPANRSVWGQLAATLWATRHVGVVASVGTYPVDFTQGYPGGQYVSVGLRLRSAPRFVLPPAIASPTRALRDFRWTRLRGESHRIRVYAGAARSVELMADFTQWRPVSMRHETRGWWSLELPIPRGTHEVNVRIDSGPWLVPPGTIARTDEFGGAVGLMVVR
jgi:hypothetical protein